MSTGWPSTSVVTRLHLRSGAPTGTANSSASPASEIDVEQLVEGPLGDVVPRQPMAELGGAPHGHDRERVAVGEIEPLHPEHRIGSEDGGDVRRRVVERELDDLPDGVLAARLELGLDRAEPFEALLHGLGRDEPSEPLASGDEPLVAADRDLLRK